MGLAAVTLIALLLSGCSRGVLYRPPGGATEHTATYPGSPGRGVVSGGFVNSRRQTSIVGLSKRQTVLTSPSLRVISNVQGTIYSD